MRTEINEIENRQFIDKINKAKAGSLGKKLQTPS